MQRAPEAAPTPVARQDLQEGAFARSQRRGGKEVSGGAEAGLQRTVDAAAASKLLLSLVPSLRGTGAERTSKRAHDVV